MNRIIIGYISLRGIANGHMTQEYYTYFHDMNISIWVIRTRVNAISQMTKTI